VSVSNHLLDQANLPTIPDCDKAMQTKEVDGTTTVMGKEKIASSQIECDLCEKIFTNETILSCHVKECHQLSCEKDKMRVAKNSVEDINKNVTEQGDADKDGCMKMKIREKNSKSLPTATKKPRLSPTNLTSNSTKTCSLCQQKFLVQSKLIEHYQLEHKMRFRTKTGQEQTFFISPQSDLTLTPGMAEQLGLSPVNPSTLPTPLPLPSFPDQSTTKPSPEGTVTCSYCGKMFINRKNMRIHMARWCASRIRPKISCSDCQKMFNNRETLLKHRTFYCQFGIGSQPETANSQVMDHIGEGTEKVEDDTPVGEKEKVLVNQFECDLCGKIFKDQAFLCDHVKMCHQLKIRVDGMNNQVEENDSNVGKDKDPKSVLKEDAGKKMRQINEEHSNFPPSATKKSRLSRQRGEGSLPCQYCNIKFYTSDNLTRHLLKSCKKTPAHIQTSTAVATATHPLSPPNSVTRTDIIEQSSTKIKQIGLVHHEERTVSCDSCAKVFGSRYEMRRHKNLTHGDGEGTVPCDNCGKMFTSLVNVKRHRKFCFADRPEEEITEQNSTKEKPQIESKESFKDSLAKIPCSDCKKMFLNMKSLMKHRQYSCQVRIRSQSETVKSLVGDYPRDQGEEGTDGEHQQ